MPRGAKPPRLIGIEWRSLSDGLGVFGRAILVPLFRELAACPQVLTASLPGRQKLRRGSGPPSTVDRAGFITAIWASLHPVQHADAAMKSGVPWQCAEVGRPGGRE